MGEEQKGAHDGMPRVDVRRAYSRAQRAEHRWEHRDEGKTLLQPESSNYFVQIHYSRKQNESYCWKSENVARLSLEVPFQRPASASRTMPFINTSTMQRISITLLSTQTYHQEDPHSRPSRPMITLPFSTQATTTQLRRVWSQSMCTYPQNIFCPEHNQVL
jgi:hypothetical protein